MELKDLIIEKAMQKVANMEKEAAVFPTIIQMAKTMPRLFAHGAKAVPKGVTWADGARVGIGRARDAWIKGGNILGWGSPSYTIAKTSHQAKRAEQLMRAARNRTAKLVPYLDDTRPAYNSAAWTKPMHIGNNPQTELIKRFKAMTPAGQDEARKFLVNNNAPGYAHLSASTWSA